MWVHERVCSVLVKGSDSVELWQLVINSGDTDNKVPQLHAMQSEPDSLPYCKLDILSLNLIDKPQTRAMLLLFLF